MRRFRPFSARLSARQVAQAGLVLSAVMIGEAAAQQQPAAPRPTPTAGPIAPVIAVVDYAAILRESLAARGANTEIAKIRQTYLSEVSQIEKQIFESEQELTRLRTTLPPDQFAQKRRDFDRKMQDARQQVSDRERKLEQAADAARNSISAQANEIMRAIALQRGINIVFVKDVALIVDTRLDITQDVMTQLNQKMPSITVPLPR